MPVLTEQQLKDYFPLGVEVLQEALFNLIESMRNKGEKIPAIDIYGLVEMFSSTYTGRALPGYEVDGVTPKSIPSGSHFQKWAIYDAGTYPGFLDGSGNPLVVASGDLTAGLLDFIGEDLVFEKKATALSLAAYYTKAEVLTVLGTTIGAQQTLYTLISEPKPYNTGLFTWDHTTSTFNGWGHNIGSPQNFNHVTVYIRVKSGQPNLTSLQFAIKIGSKSGTTIVTKTITGLNIPALTPTFIPVRFDDIIANAADDNLYLMYQSTTYLDFYACTSGGQTFTNPPYAQNSYQFNGTLNFATFLDNTIQRDAYFKIQLAQEKIVPDASFSNTVAQNSTTIQTLIASDATALRPNVSNEVKGVSIPEIQWQHTRGSIEMMGNTTYGNNGINGLGMYEQVLEKILVNAIDVPMCASGNAAITIRVYKSSVFQLNPANTTLLEEVLYPVGTFNTDSTKVQTVKLLKAYAVNVGEYVYVRGVITAGSSIYMQRWNVQVSNAFTVSGVTTAPSIGDTYTNNGSTFTVSAVSITAGAGTITTNITSGSNAPNANGTLTRTGGVGDASISFSAVTGVPLRHGFIFETTLPDPWNSAWSGASSPFYQSTFVLKSANNTIQSFDARLIAQETGNPIFQPRICIPSKIYATVGAQLNLYYDCIVAGIFNTGRSANCIVEIVCSKGATLERRWTYTPVSGDIGTTSITVNVYNVNRSLVATKTVSLVTRTNTGLASAKNILTVGDSTNQSSDVVAQLNVQFAALTGGTAPTFVGTVGSAPNKREGHGGWTFGSYATAGATLYIFNVSGVTSVGLNATYTNNGKTFTVTEVNVTAGSGYIQCTGTGAPTSSGTLTKASGTGDATLAFSSTSVAPTNPFWNIGTGALDIANYRSLIGLSGGTIDLVSLNLGINESFGGFTSDATVTGIINNAKAIIAAFVADNPAVKVIVQLTKTCCSTKDGFGANYGASGSKVSYLFNIRKLWEAMITNFDNAAYSANVEVGIAGLIIDTTYGYQYVRLAAGTFYTGTVNDPETELSHTNAVHPAPNGYKQEAQGTSPQMLAMLT